MREIHKEIVREVFDQEELQKVYKVFTIRLSGRWVKVKLLLRTDS